MRLSNAEQYDRENDHVRSCVNQPCPQAAFGVIEASAKQECEEDCGQGACGTAGMAAYPVGKPKVKASHPQCCGGADGASAVRQQYEAEAKLLVESID